MKRISSSTHHPEESRSGCPPGLYPEDMDQILIKWRNAGVIQQAFAPDAPLEKWRVLFNELYNLNLSKLSPQADRLRDR